MEQAGSNPLRYRADGSIATLIAYLRCSYHRDANPYGSGEAAYFSSK